MLITKRSSYIKQQACLLGFDYCGIAKAQMLDDDARRLENWLNTNMHGQMKYMEEDLWILLLYWRDHGHSEAGWVGLAKTGICLPKNRVLSFLLQPLLPTCSWITMILLQKTFVAVAANASRLVQRRP